MSLVFLSFMTFALCVKVFSFNKTFKKGVKKDNFIKKERVRIMKKEKIILKSANPNLYPDLEVECKVIENSEINDYLARIPNERKVVGYKTGEVLARTGIKGEEIHTTLKTVVDGKEYILSEEDAIVKERPYTETENALDVVIKNVSSTSNEEYVVKRSKFDSTYELAYSDSTFEIDSDGEVYVRCIPTYDPRVLTQVDENIIITTAWGSHAVCLAGSYIVTYNAEENDFNVLEQGAFNSTYTIDKDKTKNLKF